MYPKILSIWPRKRRKKIQFCIQTLLLTFLLFSTNQVCIVQAQLAVCPVGFVFGGLCVTSGNCPLSLPPFHCIRGSCCRDQRSLFQRLAPTFYPPGLGLNNFLGAFCFDTALNCYLYTTYCILPIYRVCMARHCARTCGICFAGLGSVGGLANFDVSAGGFGGVGFQNGFPGGVGLQNGLQNRFGGGIPGGFQGGFGNAGFPGGLQNGFQGGFSNGVQGGFPNGFQGGFG